MGRPLFEASREASSSITSQCSTRTPSTTRTMSLAIQAVGEGVVTLVSLDESTPTDATGARQRRRNPTR